LTIYILFQSDKTKYICKYFLPGAPGAPFCPSTPTSPFGPSMPIKIRILMSYNNRIIIIY